LNNKLKIAVLIWDFVTTGGAERYACEVTRRLAEQHDVHVFCQTWDDSISDKITFHKIARPLTGPGFVNQLLFSLFTRRALDNSFDIIHTHDRVTCFDILTIHCPCYRGFITEKKDFFRKLLVRFSVITSPRSLAYLWIEKKQFTLRNDRRLLAVSASVKKDVQRNYHLPDGFFSMAWPGVDYNRINAVVAGADKSALRRQYNFAPTDFILLFVGTEFKRKGLDSLFSALREYGHKKVKLLVAGGGGGKMQKYRQKAEKLKIADLVTFTGLVHDVFPLYAIADLFVLPTLADPCPMSPVEAMAAGVATVMSRSPYCGTAEHIRNGEAIILRDPRDDNELLTAIRQGMNEKCRRQLQEKGQQLAKNLSWERTTAQTLDAYHQILKSRQAINR